MSNIFHFKGSVFSIDRVEVVGCGMGMGLVVK